MTLTILRNTHKPADIAAFLGVLLKIPADSLSSLAMGLCSSTCVAGIEERAVVLALVSDVIHSIEIGEMTVEVGAAHLHTAIRSDGYLNVSKEWADGTVQLWRNK